MGLLVQEPWTSVSVWPCLAVPVIVGGLVLDGGSGSTTAVASELAALPAPPALLAVSSTLSLWPTSPSTGTYSCLVAPEMGVQLARVPSPLHCSHW